MADQYKESGNLKYTINQHTAEENDEVSIVNFPRNGERLNIFEQGIKIGIEAHKRHKQVYLVLFENKVYYAYVGTEADILRDYSKIDDGKDTSKEETTTTTTTDETTSDEAEIEKALDEVYKTEV